MKNLQTLANELATSKMTVLVAQDMFQIKGGGGSGGSKKKSKKKSNKKSNKGGYGGGHGCGCGCGW